MARKYAIRDQLAIHSLTLTVVNWIDLFIRDSYKEIVEESLVFCQKEKALNVHAYCIMTGHIHLIASVKEGELSSVVRDFKRHTSIEIKEHIENHENIESRREWLLWMFKRAGKKNSRNGEFQLWQQNNHPIELHNSKMKEQRLDYVHNNPVAAGFIYKPEDWVWSSARQYADE